MKNVSHFHPLLRLIHWLMALMIIAMLFIGVGMVSTVSSLHAFLYSLHKPLGVALLVLVLLRLYLRFRYKKPALPESLPSLQKLMAHLSHWLLYGLMLAQPLVGWAMLSAAGYPITLGAGIQLPPLLAKNIDLYAVLRPLHTALALLLFVTVMLHLAAALFHALILRDGVFASMTGYKSPRLKDEG
ncbi:cytochrome b561 [Ewingella americana]|uniref:cytochrome b n=1 Tax=Ewingella americana TaxID=41202 RepID=UPI0012ADAF1A|nr:cytochrome b/b6 domain-containing protein [Ewingella americana]MRT03562.1 cytochrome b [Ewingella americana]